MNLLVLVFPFFLPSVLRFLSFVPRKSEIVLLGGMT